MESSASAHNHDPHMQSMSAWPAPIILYASEKYLPIGTLLIPSVSLCHDPETNGNNKAYTDAFHRAERSLLICPPPQESAPKRDSRSPKYQHLPFPYGIPSDSNKCHVPHNPRQSPHVCLSCTCRDTEVLLDICRHRT